MDDKFKDLLEDEELTALRLEALASKKRKLENAENSSDSVSALPINSIVTSTSESASNVIPFVQSDRNAYNNYAWRKQNQLSRRRGGAFPKGNQRSNLIIISPVSLNEDKDSQDKIPALILPQHKWCNSGNEDSMSPKTLRRTGPTRFNRHGSDSDSSDSDYENSENDSGSNETVLQDEPPEHYSCLSPKDDGTTENVEKQRRLSFQNLENEIQSDTFEKNETTTVYNCLKNSSSSLDYTKNKSDNFVPVQNLTDNRHDWNSSVNSEYSNYNKYNSGHSYSSKPVDPTDGFVEDQGSCVVSNGESQINETSGLIAQSSDTSAWQHTGVKANNLYYSRDISKIHESARNHGLNDRKSRDYSDNRQSFQLSSEIQGPENSVWKHGERVRMGNSYFSRDSICNKTLPRNYCDDNVNSKEKMLSGNDLRFELKKRMQDMRPKSADRENCELLSNTTSDQSNLRDRTKHRFVYDEERIGDISHSDTYGSRQELNLRNRQERSFSKERDEHSINLNRRRHHRSLSRDRNKEEISCVRDRSRSEYNFSSDRSRYDRSSSLDRNKCRGRNRLERSSSRGRFDRSSSRGRFDRSSSRGRFDRSSSRGRFDRSSSRGRIERSSSRGRTERSISRGRTERSSSRGRTERSSSRGRSRRSSSRGRHRHGWECNSTKSKITYENEDSSKLEQNLNQDRNKHDYSSSQERDKHDHIVSRRGSHQEQTIMDDKSKHTRSKSRYEHRYSPSRKEYTRSSSRERGKSDYWSSRNHSRSDRSSSQDSRDVRSSSSDSQRERSSSHDRSRHDYSSSQERSKHKRSRSQDRNKLKHSQSQERSRHKKSPNLERNRHERSQSRDKSEHTGSQDQYKRERSASQDKKKHDYSSKKIGSGDDSSEIKSRHELNSDGTKNSYKSSSSKGKSKFSVISCDEKVKIESTSGQETVECTRNLQSKNFDSTRSSEKNKDDKRAEKTYTKEQLIAGDKHRQIRSRSKEKLKGRKKVLSKSSRVTNPEYENKYSRSRSSSTSGSSSSSSSSSHRVRPKIRSVPSVIKSFQPKSFDDKKETFCEVKFTGKINSQCDDSFASSRKDSVDFKISTAKCGRIDGDSKASDNSKRVPVHMRLGALPRKRVIQMTKDVEAAFVNTSSSSDGENVNTKCKRQNIRIVTDVYGSKSSGLVSETKHSGKEKPPKRSPDLYQEKSKHLKTHR